MQAGALWAIFAALITATVTGIAILLQLEAAKKERLEAIYERLMSELNNVVGEMGGWDGKGFLLDAERRVISRMLHLHLDSLVESVAIEGRSWWRWFWYRLIVGKLVYERVGGEKCFIEKHRYPRFKNWYEGILILYNQVLGDDNYVEEVFHQGIEKDPHYRTTSLEEYFQKRRKCERQWEDKK